MKETWVPRVYEDIKKLGRSQPREPDWVWTGTRFVSGGHQCDDYEGGPTDLRFSEEFLLCHLKKHRSPYKDDDA